MLGRMDFWDHLTTWLVNLPALLAALAAFIQSLRNANKAEQIRAETGAGISNIKDKVEETNARATEIVVKVEQTKKAVDQTRATVDNLGAM